MDTEDQPPMPDLEKIKAWIPGFKGYEAKDQRENSERVLRRFLAGKLGSLHRQLEEIIKRVAEEKRLDLLSDYDDLLRGIKNFLERLAEEGQDYGEFFNLIEISDNDLNEIYTFEVELLEKIAGFSEKIEALRPDPFHLNETRNLENKLEEIQKVFSERDLEIKEFQLEDQA